MWTIRYCQCPCYVGLHESLQAGPTFFWTWLHDICRVHGWCSIPSFWTWNSSLESCGTDVVGSCWPVCWCICFLCLVFHCWYTSTVGTSKSFELTCLTYPFHTLLCIMVYIFFIITVSLTLVNKIDRLMSSWTCFTVVVGRWCLSVSCFWLSQFCKSVLLMSSGHLSFSVPASQEGAYPKPSESWLNSVLWQNDGSCFCFCCLKSLLHQDSELQAVDL